MENWKEIMEDIRANNAEIERLEKVAKGTPYSQRTEPEIDVMSAIEVPLRIRGRSYKERKASLRTLAQDVQNADFGGLTYNEIAVLTDYFERAGKRYGLLKKFRENAII